MPRRAWQYLLQTPPDSVVGILLGSAFSAAFFPLAKTLVGWIPTTTSDPTETGSAADLDPNFENAVPNIFGGSTQTRRAAVGDATLSPQI